MKKIIYTIATLIFASTLLLGCTSTTLELAPTSFPSPAPTTTPLCPNVDPDVKFIYPENDTLIDDKILSYINAGGDPGNLNSFFNQYEPTTLDVVVADLNNDDSNEILVAGTVPPDLDRSGDGAVYIFTCINNTYKLEIEFNFDNMSSADIVGVEKLLADQPQQAIIYYLSIFGWASDYLVIGFINGEYRIMFQDSQIFPKLVIFDQDNDGNKELSIHSNITATQGPQREMISTFKWDGKNYVLLSNQLMPGTTRVEYLDDAQRALDQGDISMAIAYYDRAAHDDTLRNFASRGEIINHQMILANNYQISFALFRLVILWLTTGNDETARTIIDELSQQFPKNSPGYEFAEAAKIFEEQTAQAASPQQACSKVTSFFTENYPDLNAHIGDWGSSVVYYSRLVELCPFR